MPAIIANGDLVLARPLRRYQRQSSCHTGPSWIEYLLQPSVLQRILSTPCIARRRLQLHLLSCGERLSHAECSRLSKHHRSQQRLDCSAPTYTWGPGGLVPICLCSMCSPACIGRRGSIDAEIGSPSPPDGWPWHGSAWYSACGLGPQRGAHRRFRTGAVGRGGLSRRQLTPCAADALQPELRPGVVNCHQGDEAGRGRRATAIICRSEDGYSELRGP